jgi:hypothetical protein
MYSFVNYVILREDEVRTQHSIFVSIRTYRVAEKYFDINVNVTIAVVWDKTSCSAVKRYKRFELSAFKRKLKIFHIF